MKRKITTTEHTIIRERVIENTKTVTEEFESDAPNPSPPSEPPSQKKLRARDLTRSPTRLSWLTVLVVILDLISFFA